MKTCLQDSLGAEYLDIIRILLSHLNFFYFICIFFWLPCVAYRIFVPQAGIKPTNFLQWKPGIFTTGLPGKPLPHFLDWCHLLFMR